MYASAIRSGIDTVNSGSAAQVADARPSALAQMKLQAMANLAPQAQHIAQLKALAGGAPIQLLQNKAGEDWQNVLWDENVPVAVEAEFLTDPNLIYLKISRGEWHVFKVGETEWCFGYEDMEQLRPLVPDVDRLLNPWVELNEGGEETPKKALIRLVKAVVDNVPEQLEAVMASDNVFNLTAQAQLEFCINLCKKYPDAETLAKCFYTSYFYGPMNRYLRGHAVGSDSVEITNLIERTRQIMQNELNSVLAVNVELERMELKSEWLNNPVKDTVLDFAAFTSVHAEPGGVENMASDIDNGTFGERTTLSILRFNGISKCLIPRDDGKYYLTEQEKLLPPGMRAKVVNILEFQIPVPDTDRFLTGKDYILEIL